MISVIIPTLNEAENLPRCIGALRANSRSFELLVSDGGSADKTREVAQELGGRVILSTVAQRAAQLNAGAREATGEVFLFLHADTIVPAAGLMRIEETLRDAKVGGGAFARRFESNSVFLRVTCWLAELRNRTIGWHLGDQGTFARREVYEELCGFRLMDRFEDLDFSRRMGARWRLATIRPRVMTSARRFAREGPVKRTVKDFWLTIKFVGAGARRNSGAPVRSSRERLRA